MVLKSSVLLVGAPVVFGALVAIAGCSTEPPRSSNTDKPTPSEKEEEPKSARELTLEKNLGGQAIVIVPFDTTKPECSSDDPETMPRETFAACTYLDASKLPADFAVTKDPLAFKPATDRSRVLTVVASNVLENANTNRWYAIIGVGPAPTSTADDNGSLVKSSIRPRILPAIPLVIGGGGALVEGTTALFAAAAVWFGARAIVQTGQVLLEQREAATVTRAVGETMKEEATNKCSLEMVASPKADAFDCYEAGRSYGAAACESAIPQYARVRCSSNCKGPSSEFKILCPSYKVCVWDPDLNKCQRAPFSDDITSQISNGCQSALAKQKPESFCTPNQ